MYSFNGSVIFGVSDSLTSISNFLSVNLDFENNSVFMSFLATPYFCKNSFITSFSRRVYRKSIPSDSICVIVDPGVCSTPVNLRHITVTFLNSIAHKSSSLQGNGFTNSSQIIIGAFLFVVSLNTKFFHFFFLLGLYSTFIVYNHNILEFQTKNSRKSFFFTF